MLLGGNSGYCVGFMRRAWSFVRSTQRKIIDMEINVIMGEIVDIVLVSRGGRGV